MKCFFKTVLAVLALNFGSVNMIAMAGTSPVFIDAQDDIESEELLEDIIENINGGGPIAEAGREVTKEDIDFDRAYTIFNGENLTAMENSDKQEMINTLTESGHCWQLPIYVNGNTILVYIDYDSNKKEWKLGVIAVYQNEEIDYKKSIINAVNEYGLGTNECSFVFVNGIDGIKYPVAIGFINDKAEFMIPAAESTNAVFESTGGELLYDDGLNKEKADELKAGLSSNKAEDNNFYLYDFDDTIKTAKNAKEFIGDGGTELGENNIDFSILIFSVSTLIIIFAGKKIYKKTR